VRARQMAPTTHPDHLWCTLCRYNNREGGWGDGPPALAAHSRPLASATLPGRRRASLHPALSGRRRSPAPGGCSPQPPRLTSRLRGSTSGEGGWRTRWSWVIWGARQHGGKRPSRGVESHRLQHPLATASPPDHAHNVAPRQESTEWACHWHWGAGCKGCEANAVLRELEGGQK